MRSGQIYINKKKVVERFVDVVEYEFSYPQEVGSHVKFKFKAVLDDVPI